MTRTSRTAATESPEVPQTPSQEGVPAVGPRTLRAGEADRPPPAATQSPVVPETPTEPEPGLRRPLAGADLAARQERSAALSPPMLPETPAGESHAVRDALRRIVGGGSLSRAEAGRVMGDLMSGAADPVQIAALLAALAMKGVTAEELVGLAEAMLARALRLPLAEGARAQLVDTCGTGGSGLETANTSTMTAFVLAAAGLRVAKHGNRASSGRCGSADVLEGLGARIDLPPEAAAGVLERTGVAFLFAPRFHPAMAAVVPVRRRLGIPTVFNLLGPLCNPARPGRQLLGVSRGADPELQAEALQVLGAVRALVVQGADGLDELSLSGPSRLVDVGPEGITERSVRPEDLGLASAPFPRWAGGDRETNSRLFVELLSGRLEGPHRDHLLLNAGAGLLVGGAAGDLKEGVDRARELLASGEPLGRFEGWRDATQAAVEPPPIPGPGARS